MKYSLLLFLLIGKINAQTISLPEKVTGEVADFVTITAKTDGTTVIWLCQDKNLRIFPFDLLKDTRTIVVSSKTKGTYQLIAYTAKGDVPSPPAYTTVVIDGLAENSENLLQKAYAKDSDANKAVLKQNLMILYSLAPVSSSNTLEELLTNMRSAMPANSQGKLINLQTAIKSEIESALGTDLTIRYDKAKVKVLFDSISKKLANLKE